MLLNILNVFFIGFVFFTLLNLGSLFLRLLKYEPGSSVERLVLTFGSGAAFLSVGIFFVSKFIGLTQVNMLLLVCVTSVAALRETSKTFAVFKGLFAFVFKQRTPLILIAFILMLLRLLLHFFEIFLPPTAWDTIAYHYAIPQIYKDFKSITYIPFMYHSNWPQGIEMFFSFGLTAFNDYTANGMAYMFSFMLVMVAYLVGKELKSEETGILTAALTVALPIFKAQATNGQVENGLAFYELSALYCLMLWAKDKKMKLIIICGVLTGAAASVKILGGFVIVLFPVMVLISDITYGTHKRKLYFKEAFILGMTAALVCCLWYIKSWVEAGNPVWPFAYSIFGGKNWSLEQAIYRKEYYTAYGAGIGLVQLLILPYTLIFSKNMDGYVGNNVLLYLALAPYLLISLFKKTSKNAGFVFQFFIIFIVFWFSSAQLVRFLLPGFVALTALNAVVILNVLSVKETHISKKIMQGLIFVFVIFLMLYSFPARKMLDLSEIKSFIGRLDRDAYLSSQVDSYQLMHRINLDEKIKGKIMFFREVRGYYLKKEYMWGDPVNQGIIYYKSPEYTAAKMKENAIKYVLVNNNAYKTAGVDGYTQTIYDIMAEILKRKGTLLYCEKDSCLYEMRY